MDDGDGGSGGPPRALHVTTPTNLNVFWGIVALFAFCWGLQGSIWLVRHVASAF